MCAIQTMLFKSSVGALIPFFFRIVRFLNKICVWCCVNVHSIPTCYQLITNKKTIQNKPNNNMISTITMLPVTPPNQPIPLPTPVSPKDTFSHYTATVGTDITDAIINSCAQFFSSNYGVWGANVPFAIPGKQLSSIVLNVYHFFFF